MRPRNLADEYVITARCGGQVNLSRAAAELSALADERAHPGGLRDGIDWEHEAREELADCRNYLVWRRQEAITATDRERCDRALEHVIRAWAALSP